MPAAADGKADLVTLDDLYGTNGVHQGGTIRHSRVPRTSASWSRVNVNRSPPGPGADRLAAPVDIGPGWLLRVPSAPGLGIDVDEDRLASLSSSP